MQTELIFSKSQQLADYLPLIAGLSAELGSEFSRSMRNWCKLEPRPYPLLDWDVFLVRHNRCIVGICSHYRQPDDSLQRYWIGWIGVLKEYRRRGFGSVMLRAIEARLQHRFDAQEAWVYTDRPAAVAFYRANGYVDAGVFDDLHLIQAAARAQNPVLTKKLIHP